MTDPVAVFVPRRSLLFCILSLSFAAATTAHSPVAFVAPSVKMSPSAISSKSSSTLSSSTSSSSSDASAVAEACALVPNPPPTKTARGVLFDVDGTLADSWRLGYDATVVVLQNNDLGHVEMNEEIYHAHCVYATPERLARHAGLMPGYDGSDDDEEFERVGEELGRQFDEHYVALVSEKTAGFYDGMADILRNLPDETKLGALTNACAAYGHAVLEANCPVKSSSGEDSDTDTKFALYDRFATIHGADSVPAPKPSALGLLQCASELGLNPKDCIYVGDAPGDGKAAKAAGMIAVGVLWGSNSEEKMRGAETFDYLCKNVEELRMLLPQK